MSIIPEDLKYTKEHEWINNDGVCGITDHAQAELTDIVFVELPEAGRIISRGDQVCVVESVKAVSDIFAPASGTITEVNTRLEENPELVNSSPYGDGWLFKIELSSPGELDDLMDADRYRNHVE